MKDRIKYLRRSRGVTQSDLASALHVTQASVSKWETGKAYPDHDILMQLAQYFKVSTDYLLGVSDQLVPATAGQEEPCGATRVANFADRLKELRSQREIKQKDIAELLDMTVNAYQKYEYGDREPGMETFITLADYFDVSLDYLVGRSNSQMTVEQFEEWLQAQV